MTDVVVTGIGVWCAVAHGAQAFDSALREGTSGQREVTRFDVTDPVYRATTAGTLLDEQDLVATIDETMLTDLATMVATEALEDASLTVSGESTDEVGFGLGTSHGGNLTFMRFIRGRLGLPGGRVDAALTLSSTPTIAGQVARQLGIGGPTFTISTACASGTNAVGRAAELIKSGAADVMIAGGVDLYTELSYSGFNALGAMARGSCRPMDEERDGMMLGDGAAVLVLESDEHARARGARIYARILGHALATEPFHATSPAPDGDGASRVMAAALDAAAVSIDQVDYINVHGTGTKANDLAELIAIERVFGKRAKDIPIGASKSMFGHALGAAGAIEVAAVVLGVQGGYCPPTLNLETPIERFRDWTYVRDRALERPVDVALSNSFGFAGSLSAIVVGR